jgi:hypothetical protein
MTPLVRTRPRLFLWTRFVDVIDENPVTVLAMAVALVAVALVLVVMP